MCLSIDGSALVRCNIPQFLMDLRRDPQANVFDLFFHIFHTSIRLCVRLHASWIYSMKDEKEYGRVHKIARTKLEKNPPVREGQAVVGTRDRRADVGIGPYDPLTGLP